jgi:hypothetical protein
MKAEIQAYNNQQIEAEKAVCDCLATAIIKNLPEADYKIWHRHPVWFLDGNPIVGYSKQKAGIRLLFWSGASFEEDKLQPGTGKFKDASIFYTSAGAINSDELAIWLEKSRQIQWDYKNLVKRQGRLEKLF